MPLESGTLENLKTSTEIFFSKWMCESCASEDNYQMKGSSQEVRVKIGRSILRNNDALAGSHLFQTQQKSSHTDLSTN